MKNAGNNASKGTFASQASHTYHNFHPSHKPHFQHSHLPYIIGTKSKLLARETLSGVHTS